MERATKQFTISMPPDLAEQVSATAKAESRTVSELFREAFRTYRALRIQAILDASQQAGRASRHMGSKPEDIERLIHETRQESRKPRRAR